MSDSTNIFYTAVDPNLQQELNDRGLSGVNRNPDKNDLQFMLEKIANVELVAYEGNDMSTKQVGTLGGTTVSSGRYLPTGENGFLNDSKRYETTQPEYNQTIGRFVDVIKRDNKDQSRLIGPFITAVDVTVGDHSMGILNKATINITVPNPIRDLDLIEDIWLRPGRYMAVFIVHPKSAVVSQNKTGGVLTSGSLPPIDQLQKRYPNWKIDENRIKQLSYINEFMFEGLITNFEFSYQPSGYVDITLSVTGTSNTYGDIKVFMPDPTEEKKEVPKTQKPVVNTNPTYNPIITTPPADKNNPKSVKGNKSFYQFLYDTVDTLIKDATGDSTPATTGCIPYVTKKGGVTSSDQYIVYGEPYPPVVTNKQQTKTVSKQVNNTTKFSRYITLGGLIQFINDYPLEYMDGGGMRAIIACNDIQCRSNYYANLVSSRPDSILLLPKDPNKENDMNWYGSDPATSAVYYQNIKPETWSGVYEYDGTTSKGFIYPARILINLETIQDILLGTVGTDGNRAGGITEGGTRGVSLNQFISAIGYEISYATGNAISMQLVTHPIQSTWLLYTDTKFVKSTSNVKSEPVVPYSVPMFVSHPYGTIVQEFKLSATIPDNVKTLSYILNQPEGVSEEDIAPYINYMYNSKTAAARNKLIDEYSDRHKKAITGIMDSRAKFGQSPGVPELEEALRKSIKSYLKYPTNTILQTQQLTAPIFPFTAEFTIDGVNGFRYGDVLTFEVLPLKYRENVVFSIISINQKVTSTGQWTTNIRCIMRPNII